MDLFKITEDEYHEIDARLTAHYGLTEKSGDKDILNAVRDSAKNWREIAPAIGVAPEKLVGFTGEWLKRIWQ
jgi:hypothetical protein